MRRLFAPLLLIAALGGCVGGAGRMSEVPPATARPVASRPPVTAPATSTRDCMAQLSEAGVRFTPLADRDYGGGCNARGSLRLDDIGTPTTNLGPMTCGLARNFVAWVRFAVKPAGQRVFGQDVVRVETFGTYSCRNIYGGRSGRLSQHAFANAIDVSAFVLADGRRIALLGGWEGSTSEREFLRLIRASACRRFGTVLSPDYNAAHANHFHFDMSGQNYCR